MKRMLSIASLLVSCAALAANEGGNGGNGQASHFSGVGKRAGQSLKLACSDSEAPSNVCAVLPAYLQAIALTDVLPRDQVLGQDGKPRDAINDGKSKIQIDIHRWPALATQPNGAELQIRLSVHEYLGIAGIEKSDTYQISDAILELLKQDNFSLVQIVGKGPIPKTFSAAHTIYQEGNLNVGDSRGWGAICGQAKSSAGEEANNACAKATGNTCKIISSAVLRTWVDDLTGGYEGPGRVVRANCEATAVAAPESVN